MPRRRLAGYRRCRGRARSAVRVHPAGTRNHFALDLGVDRDDVVGALDAFVDGGERTVDLAEVNGRVFVNNVSLGLYAEAVQREGYRDAKLRTLLDTVPDVLGHDGGDLDLRLPALAGTCTTWAAVLVSNNRYRLGRASARAPVRASTTACSASPSSASPRAARGRPIVAAAVARVVGARLRVEADHPVPAGIDGEALVLDPPLRFRIRPGVLRVRIAHTAPGRLALGHGSRGCPGGPARAGANRRRPPPETRNVNTKEVRMDLMEITEKERLSREDAAARLHALADALARHNDIEFERGGMHFKVHVPDEIDFKLEIEIEDDERELEIELKW